MLSTSLSLYFKEQNIGLNYLLFSLLSYFLIYYTFCMSELIMPKIFSIFFFLGFWLKFTTNSLFKNNFGEGTGKFSFDLYSLNEVFIYTNISIFLIILACKNQISFNQKNFARLNFIKIIFIKNQLIFLLAFFFTLIIMIFINFKYQIFLRGLISNNNEIVNAIFNFFYSVFFIVITSLMIDFKKKNTYFVIFVITLFFLSISSLSRIMPLFIIIAICAYYYSNISGIKNFTYLNIKFLHKQKILFLIFIISFIVSLFSVAYLTKFRTQLYSYLNIETCKTIADNNEKIEKVAPRICNDDLYDDLYDDFLKIDQIKTYNSINFFYDFLIQRWVGIDSLMFILAEKNSISDYFKENYSIKDSFVYVTKNIIQVRTPGPLAFFAQYKSYIYFSFSLFVALYLLFMSEKIINFFLNKYKFTSFLLYFLLVWKFVHLGIGGINTFFYYISVYLLIIFLIFVNYIFKKVNLKVK